MTQLKFGVLGLPGLSRKELAELSALDLETVPAILGGLVWAGLVVDRPHAAPDRVERPGATAAVRRTLAFAALEADLAAGLSIVDERAIRRWVLEVEEDEARTK